MIPEDAARGPQTAAKRAPREPKKPPQEPQGNIRSRNAENLKIDDHLRGFERLSIAKPSNIYRKLSEKRPNGDKVAEKTPT